MLRGIPNDDFIEDEFPTSVLFYFEKRADQQDSADCYQEQSINWRDDDGALTLLFNQRKPDSSIQFKAGAAVLSRHELDRLISRPALKQRLSYERSETTDNRYHGNLLLRKEVSRSTMKMIAASIATWCVSEIIKNPLT
jgi:hypothetical protein